MRARERLNTRKVFSVGMWKLGEFMRRRLRSNALRRRWSVTSGMVIHNSKVKAYVFAVPRRLYYSLNFLLRIEGNFLWYFLKILRTWIQMVIYNFHLHWIRGFISLLLFIRWGMSVLWIFEFSQPIKTNKKVVLQSLFLFVEYKNDLLANKLMDSLYEMHFD